MSEIDSLIAVSSDPLYVTCSVACSILYVPTSSTDDALFIVFITATLKYWNCPVKSKFVTLKTIDLPTL